MKLATLVALIGIIVALFTGTAQADSTDSFTSTHDLTFGAGALKRTGDAIRAGHVRTVGASGVWLHQRHHLEIPVTRTTTKAQRWIPYRSPYARRNLRYFNGPFFYTYVVPFRHELACRYLADCPCRYLAGC